MNGYTRFAQCYRIHKTWRQKQKLLNSAISITNWELYILNKLFHSLRIVIKTHQKHCSISNVTTEIVFLNKAVSVRLSALTRSFICIRHLRIFQNYLFSLSEPKMSCRGWPVYTRSMYPSCYLCFSLPAF